MESLPYETVFHILTQSGLSALDVVHLCQTNKQYQDYLNDEKLWDALLYIKIGKLWDKYWVILKNDCPNPFIRFSVVAYAQITLREKHYAIFRHGRFTLRSYYAPNMDLFRLARKYLIDCGDFPGLEQAYPYLKNMFNITRYYSHRSYIASPLEYMRILYVLIDHGWTATMDRYAADWRSSPYQPPAIVKCKICQVSTSVVCEHCDIPYCSVNCQKIDH